MFFQSRHLVSRLESETEKWRWDNRRHPYPGDPAEALKRIKLPADVIAPMLRTAMTSQDPWVRLQATDVLCDAAERPGAPDPVLTELLLGALQDRESLIRIRAAEGLACLDDNSRRKAVDILLGQLRRPDRLEQLVAAIGLARFAKEGQASVRILTDRFRGGRRGGRIGTRGGTAGRRYPHRDGTWRRRIVADACNSRASGRSRPGRPPTAIPTLLALAERRAPVRPGESDWQAELRLATALERRMHGQ